MGRPLRFIPPGSLVEVTTRTIQGRYLLRPSRDLSDLTNGLLARAGRLHDVDLVAFSFPSNHYHLLAIPADAAELAGFMNYFNGNLAREAGRLHDWRDKFWARPYRAIVVSDEPAKQIERLRYVLEQGCKEGLVRRPQDWPGATSTHALLRDRQIEGLWFDRTAEYRARLRGESPRKYAFASQERLKLVSLPCWRHLDPEDERANVQGLVDEIEAETRRRLRREGRAPIGRKKILREDPHRRPEKLDTSPAPRFHAATVQARRILEQAYSFFLASFREAGEAFREGRIARFPEGSFPPAAPFVRHRSPPLIA